VRDRSADGVGISIGLEIGSEFHTQLGIGMKLSAREGSQRDALAVPEEARRRQVADRGVPTDPLTLPNPELPANSARPSAQ
jgi:hypothetical protein